MWAFLGCFLFFIGPSLHGILHRPTSFALVEQCATHVGGNPSDASNTLVRRGVETNFPCKHTEASNYLYFFRDLYYAEYLALQEAAPPRHPFFIVTFTSYASLRILIVAHVFFIKEVVPSDKLPHISMNTELKQYEDQTGISLDKLSLKVLVLGLIGDLVHDATQEALGETDYRFVPATGDFVLRVG
jgi:hypothetical protein